MEIESDSRYPIFWPVKRSMAIRLTLLLVLFFFFSTSSGRPDPSFQHYVPADADVKRVSDNSSPSEWVDAIRYDFQETGLHGTEDIESEYEKTTHLPTRELRKIVLESIDNDITSVVSIDLRKLIEDRRAEYLEDLAFAASGNDKLPHPSRLLHYLAPKIPVIRQSKDATLRIRVGRSEIDSGLAACLLTTLVIACDEYDKVNEGEGVYTEIVKDRRFEQVVECLLCGVGPDLLEDDEVKEGLSLLDCCRAAWAFSRIHRQNPAFDVSSAVQVLAARSQALLQASLLHLSTDEVHAGGGQTLDDRLQTLARRLALDAAVSMWSFAQISSEKFSFSLLFDTCCRCLISDPIDMRKSAQDVDGELKVSSIELNDVIERLAVSEGSEGAEEHNHRGASPDAIVDWLSAGNLKDVLLALAMHGTNTTEDNLKPQEVFRELAFDRVLAYLKRDLSTCRNFTESSLLAMENKTVEPLTPDTDDDNAVSAAAILANEENPTNEEALPTLNSPGVEYFFDAEDLCAIAWAATELNDPLHDCVVVAVAELLVGLGPSSLADCSGEHLSDLLRAVAKTAAPSESEFSTDELGVILSGWSVDELRLRVASVSSILDVMPPHELSRLLWSLATIYDRRAQGTRIAITDASFIGESGITAAVGATNLFSCEDLARTIWAFGILCDPDTVLTDRPHLAVGLGRIVSIVENFLVTWETCTPSLPRHTQYTNHNDLAHRVSFLGKRKMRFPFIDQKLDDILECSESMDSPRSGLPRLRDLPLDPLTLCKLTCTLRNICKEGNGSYDTFVRIALRLFTSRNGRLMKECPVGDLLYLVKAAANANQFSGREQLVHFVRAFLSLLNSSQKQLSSLVPQDYAVMLYSLSQLGVKHSVGSAEEASAHRRLHLVAELPNLEKGELLSLSDTVLLQMLDGISKLGAVVPLSPTVARVLEVLEDRFQGISGARVCQLVNAICNLHSSLYQFQDSSSDSNGEASIGLTAGSLDTSCNRLLVLVSLHCSSLLCSIRTKELTRIMAHVVKARLSIDELVLTIENETIRRLDDLVKIPDGDANGLAEKTRSLALEIRSLVADTELSNEKSSIGSLKPKFLSLLGSKISEKNVHDLSAGDPTSDADNGLPYFLGLVIQMANELEAHQLYRQTPITREVNQENFLLGQCQELIRMYREQFEVPQADV